MFKVATEIRCKFSKSVLLCACTCLCSALLYCWAILNTSSLPLMYWLIIVDYCWEIYHTTVLTQCKRFFLSMMLFFSLGFDGCTLLERSCFIATYHVQFAMCLSVHSIHEAHRDWSVGLLHNFSKDVNRLPLTVVLRSISVRLWKGPISLQACYWSAS